MEDMSILLNQIGFDAERANYMSVSSESHILVSDPELTQSSWLAAAPFS
jgi:hypothetical protein